MSQEQDSSSPLSPKLGDAVDLLDRGVDVAVGQAGEADLPVGMMPAEVSQPIVVDTQHLVGRFRISDPRGDPENTKDDLGIDPITVHILDPLVRIAGAPHAFPAILVEARFGHLVDPVVLAGDKLPTNRPDTAYQSHINPSFGRPAQPVRAVLHVWHAVLQFPFCLRHEQICGQPWKVEMTISRNPLVLHGSSSILL